MAKQAKKKGAQQPVGAGRTETKGAGGVAGQWTIIADKKAKIKQLKAMALKLVPKEQRKGFIAQGMKAIERQEAEGRMSAKVKAIYADLAPVLTKHGAASFHVLVKLPVDTKDKELGIKGWSLNSDVRGADSLEMIAVLFQSLTKLSASNFNTVKP